MTICNPCIRTKAIASCLGEIIIGTVTEQSQTLSFYVRDITTGNLFTMEATTDGAGLATADVSDFNFMPEHAYESWLTKQGDPVEERLPVTIGASTSETICIDFEMIKNSEGIPTSIASQTLAELE